MPTPEEILDGRPYAVVEADCLEFLPTITGQVDHIICDPPYESEAHTKGRRACKKGGGEIYEVMPIDQFAAISEADRKAVGGEFARLSRRWIMAFCQIEAVAAWREAIRPAKWIRGQVWIKPDSTPQFTGDRPAQGFECIATAHSADTRVAWNGGGARGVYTHCVNVAADKAGHPTQKPLSLMLELVELFTSPNDIILDPFLGSATTALAALRLGRRCIGIERDPKYAQLSRDRLQAEASSSTLQAYRSGQLPLLR